MIINDPDDDLKNLFQEFNEQIDQKEVNAQIVTKSQAKWFEKTVNALSKADDKFDPFQDFIAKTLGIK